MAEIGMCHPAHWYGRKRWMRMHRFRLARMTEANSTGNAAWRHTHAIFRLKTQRMILPPDSPTASHHPREAEGGNQGRMKSNVTGGKWGRLRRVIALICILSHVGETGGNRWKPDRNFPFPATKMKAFIVGVWLVGMDLLIHSDSVSTLPSPSSFPPPGCRHLNRVRNIWFLTFHYQFPTLCFRFEM